MTTIKTFSYNPREDELEKASNSYLMSLIAIMVGLPLPIINLIATFIFFLGNIRGTYFVRWHCIQSLFSQVLLVCINFISVSWTLSIIFSTNTITNAYIGYVISAIIINVLDFIGTMYTMIKVRKGYHVEWWFFGRLTHAICRS